MMKADLVFLVDDSGSVGHTNFALAMEWIRDIASTVGVGPDKVQ